MDKALQDRDAVFKVVRAHLLQAQNRMKQIYDKGHQEQNFIPGEWVYLRLQQYRQHTVARHTHPKLAPRFFGPFRILAKIGEVAYKLALPSEAKIHNVFHVSLLKKYVGPNTSISPMLPVLREEINALVPQAILDTRVLHGNMELLIHWRGHSPADATWESQAEMGDRFPNLALEDKDKSKEDGVLRTRHKDKG